MSVWIFFQDSDRECNIKYHTVLLTLGCTSWFISSLNSIDPTDESDLNDKCSTAGLSNCSWSSCREGCTRDIFSCHHILVEYTYLQEDYRLMNILREQQGLGPGPTKHEAVLMVNVKGCGYPPSVNCSSWVRQFGVVESTFPCYYARTNQSLAITHLDTRTDLRDLLLSTCIPLTACLVR